MADPMKNWAAFYKPKYDEWQVAIPFSEGGMKCALFCDGINPDLGDYREPVCRLIAAAPDLREALENALAAGLPELVATAARAALAKARGEQ